MPVGQVCTVDMQTGAYSCVVSGDDGIVGCSPCGADDLVAPVTTPALARRLLAEALGTAFLVTAVIGSGIAAARLSPTDIGLQLFENAAATAAALTAIILTLAPVSGAHVNPVVTITHWVLRRVNGSEAAAYVGAQLIGGATGAVVANVMFSLPAVQLSTSLRSSGALWSGELLATFGLLLVIFGSERSGRTATVALAVGSYIGAAYFFTSSTSFANPAVTVARTLSNTFAGIAPASVGPFVAAQLVGGVLAFGVMRVLYPRAAAVGRETCCPTRERSMS